MNMKVRAITVSIIDDSLDVKNLPSEIANLCHFGSQIGLGVMRVAKKLEMDGLGGITIICSSKVDTISALASPDLRLLFVHYPMDWSSLDGMDLESIGVLAHDMIKTCLLATIPDYLADKELVENSLDAIKAKLGALQSVEQMREM
jgi:hypothetical protein